MDLTCTFLCVRHRWTYSINTAQATILEASLKLKHSGAFCCGQKQNLCGLVSDLTAIYRGVCVAERHTSMWITYQSLHLILQYLCSTCSVHYLKERCKEVEDRELWQELLLPYFNNYMSLCQTGKKRVQILSMHCCSNCMKIVLIVEWLKMPLSNCQWQNT